MTPQLFRLFVSSPGDVPDERRRVDLVVERLNAEFEGRVRIELVRWETTYYSAHATFQQQIPEAADCDVVVAVFRARLGTPLPADFPRRLAGEPYPSGTAYEVLSAIEARNTGKRLPDIYVFRYPNAPSVVLDAPDRGEIELQWHRLKGFFDAWFRTRSGEFIAAFQDYASPDDFAAKVEDCLRQWLARNGFMLQGPVWDRVLRGSPFPGLAAFDAARGSVFFGRDLAVAQAVSRLRQADADGVPFLLVIGASGSGKSSLLRAGLLPRLTLPGTIPEIDLWRTAIVTPGPNPFLSLADVLLADDVLGPELREGIFRTRELLAMQLCCDVAIAPAPLRDALDRIAVRRQTEEKFAAPRPARLALAIDQAERLFTEADIAAATAFATLLAALVREHLAYLTVVLRSDAYALFQNVDAFIGLREAGATLDLVPPNAAELEEIVTQPVAACRPPLMFEQRNGRSLASVLVADAKGGDALPLLQMTLARLYAAEAERGDGMLRFADYHGMGEGVTQTANEALDTLREAARAELPSLIAGLVSDVASDPLTGSPTPIVLALDLHRFEAGKPARSELIDAFVEKRLLTTEGDGVSRRVRPVHEGLLRIWPQAVAIIGETAQLIRVRHTLEGMVREWVVANHDAKHGHLELSPALLDGAQRLLVRFEDDLPPAMCDFITQAGMVDAARRDRERQDQERRILDAQALAEANRRIARRTLAGLGVAVLLLVIAALVSIYADIERTRAEFALGRSLWGELDFDSPVLQREEINGLWQVATSSDRIRRGFIAPLTSAHADPSVVLRFSRRPEAVLRAVGIGRLSPADASAAQSQVLAALGAASDPEQIEGLAAAAAALPVQAGSEQLVQPLAAILKALADPANYAQLRGLGSALRALAGSVSPAQAAPAYNVALAALMLTTDPEQVRALDLALQVLARRLDADQAAFALTGVLTALHSTADARQIKALAHAAQVLAAGLTSTQANAQVGPFLDSLRGTMDPGALDAFTQAAGTIIDRLGIEQTIAKYPAGVSALANPSDYGHLQALTQALLAVARKLPVEQAEPMMTLLLTALAAISDPDQSQALGVVIAALGDKLTATQAEPAGRVLADAIVASTDAATIKVLSQAWRALPGTPIANAAVPVPHVLDIIAKVNDADQYSDLARALQGLPGSLSSDQGAVAIAPLLAMLRASTDPDELASLVSAAQALAGKLQPDVALSAQDSVNSMIRLATDPDQLAALAEVLQALHLPLEPSVAGRDMAALLKMLSDTTDPDERRAVAMGVQAIAGMLEAADAAASLPSVLGAMADSDDGSDDRRALSAERMALVALLARLDEVQVQASLAVVLHGFGTAASPALRQQEATVIGAIADRLSTAQLADMTRFACWRLAEAGWQPEAAAWATALVALARRTPDTEGQTIMEALRYPTTADQPTEVFLAALHDRYPQTVPAGAGLLDTVLAVDVLLGKDYAAGPPVRPTVPALMGR